MNLGAPPVKRWQMVLWGSELLPLSRRVRCKELPVFCSFAVAFRKL